MTDKKLLELAAKAAGIDLRWHQDGTAYSDVRCAGYWEVWNPLLSDGDALRLAVKMGVQILIDIECGDVCASVYKTDGKRFTACETSAFVADPYAATRRAIVRAAAEIGKGMKCLPRKN